MGDGELSPLQQAWGELLMEIRKQWGIDVPQEIGGHINAVDELINPPPPVPEAVSPEAA